MTAVDGNSGTKSTVLLNAEGIVENTILYVRFILFIHEVINSFFNLLIRVTGKQID